jgi:hypothetical protein
MKFFSNQEIMDPLPDRLNYPQPDNKNMYKFILKAINNVKIVRFSFVKIPDFLASLSGLLLNLLLVLTVVFNLFNYFDAKQNIISKIMKYKDFITQGHKKALDYLEKKFIYAEEDILKRNRTLNHNNNNNKDNNIDDKSKYNLNLNEKESKGKNYYNKANKNYNDKDNNNYNDIEGEGNDNNNNDEYVNDFIKGKEEFFPIIRSKDSEFNSLKEKISIEENEEDVINNINIYCNNNQYINKNHNDSKITALKLNQDQIINHYNSNQNKHKNKNKSNDLVNDIDIGKNLDSLNESLNSEICNNEDNSRQNNPYLLKISDFFCLCCRSKTVKKKIDIFKNAENKFNYNLDLVTYMRKMQEIEILKFLILDKDTIRLMNFIAKPSVSFSNKEINDPEYDLFFTESKKKNSLDENNIDKVKIAFDNILTKKKLKNVDRRILKLFKIQVEDLLN